MYNKLLLSTFEASHINEVWRQLNEILSKKQKNKNKRTTHKTEKVRMKMNVKKRGKWKMKKTKRSGYDENCPAILLARVKANLMTFSAFSFKKKTHFSDMKCGPLSANGVLSCLQAANICHKINLKLSASSFVGVAQL